MADAIVHAIEAETSLAVEAATGIGKSLAYLVAIATLDVQALISTETKILQNQLRDKDIPLLVRALGRPIDVATLKGRGSYVCALEFEKLEAADRDGYGATRDKTFSHLWPALRDWVHREQEVKGVAELTDAPVSIPADVEAMITTDHDRCLGRKCPLIASCFSERARERAKTADVVIVNHHLLLLDGKLGGQILPAKDVVIVDEAHALEDVASSVFSTKISMGRWTWLQRQVQQLSAPIADTVSELLNAAKSTEAQRDFDRWLDELAHAIDEARGSAENRFTQWTTALGERRPMPIPDAPELAPQMRHIHSLLRRIVAAAAVAEVSDATLTLWDRVRRAAEHLAADLARAFEEPPSEALVRFIEADKHWPVVKLVPIDVSSELRQLLWGRKGTVIATSATLTTGGNFAFWRARVGATADLSTLALASPFNYPQQARLYLPRPASAYEPSYPSKDTYPHYVERMVATLTDLIHASSGRALILCTSYRAMRLWAERVRQAIPWTVLVQGEASHDALLHEFTEDIHSVLFGTKSFWQGVDVPGESLSLLVIDKLPFPNQDDPVIEAQRALIDRVKPKASFKQLCLPLATLAVRQGVGRLIRRVSDRGVIALLDGRLQTMGYGPDILRSLPPAPKVYRLEDVQAFFAEEGGLTHG